MDNLLVFLKKQKKFHNNLPEIQCSEFCNLINWIEQFNEYSKNQKQIKDIKDINLWENLVICETSKDINNFQIDNNLFIKKPFFHFTTSIWQWLFISKFWKWNIYITTFEEMHKIYNYSKFYILKKKED